MHIHPSDMNGEEIFFFSYMDGFTERLLSFSMIAEDNGKAKAQVETHLPPISHHKEFSLSQDLLERIQAICWDAKLRATVKFEFDFLCTDVESMRLGFLFADGDNLRLNVNFHGLPS
jgi:hypothetical protein